MHPLNRMVCFSWSESTISLGVLTEESFHFISVQFSCSVLSDSLRPHETQHASPPCPSATPRVYQIHAHWVSDASNHLILCPPLLFLPAIFPSIRVFSNESALQTRWPKYWSFRFNVSPSNEHPELISFRMDWLHRLQPKGLSRVFSNTTVQKHQLFFFLIVQLSHPYMTTGKTIALTRWTFVDKVMSLLFNVLSRLVITFLPRSVF